MPLFLDQYMVFLSENPALRLLQGVILIAAILDIFLVLFAVRDVILRCHSFLLQGFFILLVALLPIVGFLLYLLFRPSSTVRERHLEQLLLEYLDKPRPAKKIP